MSDLAVKLAVAVLMCAWIGDLIRGMYQRRKVKSAAVREEADGAQIIVSAAKDLLGPLQKRIKEMEADAAALRLELKASNEKAHTLSNKMNDMTLQLDKCSAENTRITTENRRLRQLLAGGNT